MSKRIQMMAADTAGATLSPCATYRYNLWRAWDPSKERVLWVMLNPSTADASQNDPTIRRCIGFSMAWGFGSLEVVNLFALRATDPNQLSRHGLEHAIGPDNDRYIQEAMKRSTMIVCAWGSHKAAGYRSGSVLDLLGRHTVMVLGKNKNGGPKHPLYIKKSTQVQGYMGI